MELLMPYKNRCLKLEIGRNEVVSWTDDRVLSPTVLSPVFPEKRVEICPMTLRIE